MNRALKSAERARSEALARYRKAQKRHRGQRKAWAELRDATTAALEVYADLLADAGPLFRRRAA